MEFKVTRRDLELVAAARHVIESNYREGWHHVGAAIRTSDGKIYTGIHLEANVGRIAVCAEPIALANAILAGKHNYDTIVAVKHPNPEKNRKEFEIASPCGMCREIITDYDPGTKVIIQVDGKLKKVLMIDLLPHKFV